MSLPSFPGASDNTSNIGSGGEIESPLTPWFGAPNQAGMLNIDIEGKNPHITHNLPMAYWGKSKSMETLIEFRVTNKSEWYTTDLMPWKASQDKNLHWTVLSYDKSYFEVEPYGGNPNYIQSGIQGFNDKMIQRGMAFTIAHGFWKTQMGQDQYRMNFEVLESSAQLTVYNLIIMAILKAKNVYRNFELRFKNPVTTIPQALKRLKIRWAILNKGMDEFRKFHADLVEVMEQNGVKPNLWALPPKSKILMTHAHKSETEYSSAGNLAIDARLNGQSAVDTFRGLKVRETTIFSDLFFGKTTQPLRRLREYGSFHTIRNFYGGARLETYRNEDRFAAKILDAAKDGQETKVSGLPLFKLSLRFDADGHLSRYHRELISENKLNEMRRRLNDRHDNPYIDMYIGYDTTRDPVNPYHVMEYLGEQWDCDVTRDQIKHFSQTACNKLLKAMTPEEYQAIDEADQFMDGLTRVSLLGNNRYYFLALALSGSVGDNSPARGTELFKDNGSGAAIPPVKDADGNLAIMRGGVPATVYFSNTMEMTFKSATGFNPVKFEFEPMGLGTPAGLRTLSRMYLSKNLGGYPEETMKKANLHYQTLVKFFGVHKRIFRDHELTEDRACPFYFRTSVPRDNQITAFGLNLYNHAKYPIFALRANENSGVYDFSATDDDNHLRDPNFPDWLRNIIAKGATALNIADMVALNRRMDKLSALTDSGIVRAALADNKTATRLEKNYRGKAFKATTTYNLEQFLAYVLNGKTQEAAGDVRAIQEFTAVMEILLRDNLDTPVNWGEELAKAGDRVITLKSLGAKKTVPNVGELQKSDQRALNTRFAIDPEAFREIAAMVEGGANVDEVMLGVPVRPMNIFNPTQPLGLFESSGATYEQAEPSNGLISEFKYAQAPVGRNTVSSLTTSAVFSAHLGRSATQSVKRSIPEDFQSSSASLFKRRMVGGVVASTSIDNVGARLSDDPVTARQRLASAIPQAQNTYVGLDDMNIENDSTLPMHIALDAAYRVFTFDGSHQDVAGGHAKVYRTKLVEKFHDWSKETDSKIRIFAQSWLTSKIKRQTYEAFWEEDCIPLVAFELWRLRQRYFMGSGFMAEGGDRLGNAFHGFHDFQWSDDIIRKVHVGHYTFEVACPVRDPKMFALVEDIVAMGYVSGEDVSFLQGPEEFHTLCTDPDNAPGSIVVKMVPYNRELPASPQDIGGRWNAAITLQIATDGLSSENPIHGQSAYYYNHVYGFDRLNNQLVSREPTFHSPNLVINTVGWRGHHRVMDPITERWDAIILDDGLFGSQVYKGCISDRDVVGRPLQDMQFEKTCQIIS